MISFARVRARQPSRYALWLLPLAALAYPGAGSAAGTRQDTLVVASSKRVVTESTSALADDSAGASKHGKRIAGAVSQVAVNTTAGSLPASLRQVNETGAMTLHVREGSLLQLSRPVARVLVADPSIASFQVPSPTSIFVFAQSVGKTTLYALDENDHVVAAVRVTAEHNLGDLKTQIEHAVPSARITLEPTLNNRVIVRGSVHTPAESKQVVDLIQAYLEASSGSQGGGQGGGAAAQSSSSKQSMVINQLKVEVSSQVNIQVRVVEVSRSLAHDLGFNWATALTTSGGNLSFGTGNAAGLFDAISGTSTIGSLLPSTSTGGAGLGGFTTRGRASVGGLITALTTEGLATLLAEPNLTAMSGQSAAFAAGGEVPVVIITNNTVQIDYKSYGVILRVTPTVLSANRISLHIAPEVSELTDEGSVTLTSGSTIPALTVRRADTTVELASGQSFALAGMLRANNSHSISGVPGLSSIPWLGRLFETESTSIKETELVILVTANVVDPVAASDLQVPGQGLQPIDAGAPREAIAGYLY